MMSSRHLPKDEVEFLKKMVPTVSELRIIDLMRDYRAIRDTYFGNSVPPVEVVLLRFLPRKEIVRLGGYDDPDTDGWCMCGEVNGHALPTAILLSDDLRLNEVGIALRHEMAHLKTNLKFGKSMGEGKYWKKEIRRLVAAGAYDGFL